MDLFRDRDIGNSFGGFIDYTNENTTLIECMEVAIKVRGNYCGFLPTKIKIDENGSVFMAQIEIVQNPNLVGK